MKDLTIERFAGLVRTASVHRVFLTPYPAIDGGGWFLDVDHSDHGLTRQVQAQRNGVRVFKSADTAIKALHECSYAGSVVVVMKPEGGK
ncbi:hypothetical protein PO883_33190 [Massilia sp. DJPM01]|jgi:hypothetical protein|uniref:hypothetical protein n=1 Tax=Massilia sp. DJPM01 TaxID=3024404 RepID=UPI00259E94A0|nr:hypothetical protein [Massilia sp. DJPM01]MDM5182031.1 hypothetical protein [Massilia sp. DJPM01]